MVDIIIPTLKTCGWMENIMRIVELNTIFDHRLIVTGQQVSAAKNRNFGLEACTSDIIIMIDDDIRGFYRGWNVDLIEPFKDKDVVMVSARLMEDDNVIGANCANNFDLSKDFIEIKKGKDNVMPSAAIAFRNVGLRFDEVFIGSGWEDTDFCFKLADKIPNGKFIINNTCKLIHLNEMKNQLEFDKYNREYFYKKWNIQN